MSGLPVDPLYAPKDGDPADSIGWPGQYPYTRGVHPSGYRGRLWTMRMFAGSVLGGHKHQIQRDPLSRRRGFVDGIDMPTLMGLDSDDVLSVGEVGRCGVAVDTIEDMRLLYNDIDGKDHNLDDYQRSRRTNMGDACC